MEKKVTIILGLILISVVMFTGGVMAQSAISSYYNGFPVVNVTVDGEQVKFDVPAIQMDERTLVPLRFVSEALGAEVKWDNTSKTAHISKNSQQSESSKSVISFSGETVTANHGYTTVRGKAKNNDTKKHSFVLMVYFYAENGSLLGTATGNVIDIEPGETKEYTAIGKGDFTGAASHRAEVDWMIV